jgi:hypothetical protein
MRKWHHINPLWLALISWSFTIGGYSAGEVMIRNFAWGRDTDSGLPSLLVMLAVIAPLVAGGLVIASYKRNAQTLATIVYMYLGLILLCANLNFLIMLHFGEQVRSPFTACTPYGVRLLPDVQHPSIFPTRFNRL